jgi:hypothetical protein
MNPALKSAPSLMGQNVAEACPPLLSVLFAQQAFHQSRGPLRSHLLFVSYEETFAI